MNETAEYARFQENSLSRISRWALGPWDALIGKVDMLAGRRKVFPEESFLQNGPEDKHTGHMALGSTSTIPTPPFPVTLEAGALSQAMQNQPWQGHVASK